MDRWHRNPTPSSGGIAVFFAAAAIYCVLFLGQQDAIALGAAALWLLGLIDDRVRLRPSLKLLGQCAVCAAIVGTGIVFHPTASLVFNVLFSFVWLVGITNAFNLIDNMDGLCAGVAVIIAGFRFCLLTWSGNWADANLCLLIAAVYMGFLVLNYSPARIFMGDCGSMLAGFTLAALTIASPLPHTKAFVAGVFYPALTFTYPIFDTALVSVLRNMAGRPISVGGRDHSSHRLVSLGLSESRVVQILWVLTAVGSSLALVVHWIPMAAAAVSGLVFVALTAFGVFLAALPASPLPSGSRVVKLFQVHDFPGAGA
jgi:UDP-GlcNAc:undecaprenyl-phosphate GlcNAc-1-phosphate transferase